MYIKRDLESELDRLVRLFKITAIVGPRQAGKTTLLRKHLQLGGPQSYISFDDPDVLTLFDRDIKHFEKQYLGSGGIAGLDEVQYGRNAGRKLKYLADRGHHLIITSSSELILGRQVLSQLVGRVGILRLFPFSLNEFFRAAGLSETTPETSQRSVWEHAVYGGYPKVALTAALDDKRTVLASLYDTLLYKDVSQTFTIGDLAGLERLVRFLAINIGSLLNYQTAGRMTGLSYPTLKKYLDALEKSYLIRLTPPLAANPNKEIVKQAKVYFTDTGLRNAVLGKYPASMEDQGPLFENYVLTELMKLGVTIKYWRTKTKAEVDFVVQSQSGVIPIEVKLKPAGMPAGLAAFISHHRPERCFIVCAGGPSEHRAINGCRVQTVTVDHLAELIVASVP